MVTSTNLIGKGSGYPRATLMAPNFVPGPPMQNSSSFSASCTKGCSPEAEVTVPSKVRPPHTAKKGSMSRSLHQLRYSMRPWPSVF